MISPTSGLSGTSPSPISVTAINDGAVLIDGQDVRVPLQLVDNDYWIVEGINFANSPHEVVGLGPGADFNIIRRSIAWNAGVSGNYCVWWANGNTGNLFEDVAGFGTGRKTFCNSQGGNNLTIRRAWGMWNRSTSTAGPNFVFSNAYNSSGAIYENVIGTWDEDLSPSVHTQNQSILGQDHNDFTTPSQNRTNDKYLGSIAYALASQRMPPGGLNTGGLFHSQYVDGSTAQDVVVYLETNDLIAKLDNLYKDPAYAAATTGIYTRGTEIGSGGSTIGNEWSVTNRATGARVSAVPNIWNGSGSTGARVCYRYVGGVLTGDPLWPWPMNQRIVNALIAAGRKPVDVTATMESIFGAIPAKCRQSGAMASPANLRAVTIIP